MASREQSISEDVVLSDVHLYCENTYSENDKYVLSRFYFTQSQCDNASIETRYISGDATDEGGTMFDEDGDLMVRRTHNHKNVITIEHMLATPINSVGNQVWRGSLLLCDFILHNETKFDDSVVAELGAGVGLCSIVVARVAKNVYCTDLQRCLSLCQRNITRNERLYRNLTEDNQVVWVKELDFFKSNNIFDADENFPMRNLSVILAADVIYDDEITDAFLKTLVKLLELNPQAVVYLSLEKRLNFTLEDMDVVCPAYDYFTRRLKENIGLRSKQLPVNFPQYFQYERVKELELWKISSLLTNEMGN